VVQQLLPILTYGCEVYLTRSEQQRRLANEMERWVVGAYRGSRADKAQALCGISGLGELMACKRIRWAAPVYGRHIPELREIVEPFLRELLEDTELRWMKGSKGEQGRVEIEELRQEKVEEWADGSRSNERAARASRTRETYLGTVAAVADVESVGVMGGVRQGSPR